MRFQPAKTPMCVIAILFIYFMCMTAQAATFQVTSPQCSGPGSIVDAVNQANSTPGIDTITFPNNFIINRISQTACQIPVTNDPSQFYMATVTEDLIFEGRGVRLEATPLWVTVDGLTNINDQCPSLTPGATVISEAPGFLRVEDNVTVQISDMSFSQLSALIQLRDNATVTINNSQARHIIDWFNNCDRPAIWGAGGQVNVNINNSSFDLMTNHQRPIGTPGHTVLWTAAITAEDGAVLNVENSQFTSANRGAIQWGGTANIVNSQFINSGWINANNGQTNIVNSLFVGVPGFSDFARIFASGNAQVNIQASTLYVGYNDCPPGCVHLDGTLIANDGAQINLQETAIGVGLPQLPGMLLRTNNSGTIIADALSWLQPVQEQGAPSLEVLTNQPNLLTSSPGLSNRLPDPVTYISTVTPLLGTPGNPGVLIDAIADASPSGSNELINPIDGSTIANDVLGNPRVDANGTRNIGAIQVTLAPFLVLTNTDIMAVSLAWSRPQDPTSGAITGYEVCYATGTPPDVTTLGTVCPGTLTQIATDPAVVSGLVEQLASGDYWFILRATNNSGPGPWSNLVRGTIAPPPLPPTPVSLSFMWISILLTLSFLGLGYRHIRNA